MLFLNISTQNARININTINPQLALETTRPQVQLSTRAAKVEIKQTQGELEIDQSPCRASLNLKKWSDIVSDAAEEGKNAVLEAIENIAEEGDRIAAIEKEPNAIIDIAAEKIVPAEGDLEISWIENPYIDYHVKPTEFTVVPGTIDLQFERGTVESNLQRGRVNIGISQYQSIKFWTTENNYDTYV